MSQLYEGWDFESMLRCMKERMDNIRALCDVVLDSDGVRDEARVLAKDVLYELDGCDVHDRA